LKSLICTLLKKREGNTQAVLDMDEEGNIVIHLGRVDMIQGEGSQLLNIGETTNTTWNGKQRQDIQKEPLIVRKQNGEGGLTGQNRTDLKLAIKIILVKPYSIIVFRQSVGTYMLSSMTQRVIQIILKRRLK